MTLLPKNFSIIKLRVRKPRFFVGAVGCSLALLLRGNARMRTLLLLFPKISLRCDFWEPCLAPPNCRILATQFGKSECGALIMESISQGSRKSQRAKALRDFWERGKTMPQRMRVGVCRPVARRALFCRAAERKTAVSPQSGRARRLSLQSRKKVLSLSKLFS